MTRGECVRKSRKVEKHLPSTGVIIAIQYLTHEITERYSADIHRVAQFAGGDQNTTVAGVDRHGACPCTGDLAGGSHLAAQGARPAKRRYRG